MQCISISNPRAYPLTAPSGVLVQEIQTLFEATKQDKYVGDPLVDLENTINAHPRNRRKWVIGLTSWHAKNEPQYGAITHYKMVYKSNWL